MVPRLETPVHELLQSACASIQLRLRTEILQEDIPLADAAALRERILQDGLVQQILASQGPDGWIGLRFHGYDGLEAGLRVLCEKGLGPQYPPLRRALLALETNESKIGQELGRVGQVLDEGGFGGIRMMHAAVFAYAGMEAQPLVRQQIQSALDVLAEASAASTIEAICEPYHGKLVFRPGIRWPGLYHLRLLAFTHSWRTEKNLEIVITAVRRLVQLSPLPYIRVRHRSQLMAPPAFAMQDFCPRMEALTAAEWMVWYHRMELLARLGVVNEIPQLKRQLEALQRILDEGGGWFHKEINPDYFKRWGAYTGMMLEQDWKTKLRRACDLTFRSLLIKAYAERIPVTPWNGY